MLEETGEIQVCLLEKSSPVSAGGGPINCLRLTDPSQELEEGNKKLLQHYFTPPRQGPTGHEKSAFGSIPPYHLICTCIYPDSPSLGRGSTPELCRHFGTFAIILPHLKVCLGTY